MAKLTFEIQGLEELRRKTNNPELVRGPLGEAVRDVAEQGLQTAKTAIAGGTGAAVQSLSTSIQALQGSIQTSMPERVTSTIESGRPPGSSMWPMVSGLTRWAAAVGFSGNVYALAYHLARSGTRGKRFFALASQKMEQVAPGALDEAGRKIVQTWG